MSVVVDLSDLENDAGTPNNGKQSLKQAQVIITQEPKHVDDHCKYCHSACFIL